MNQYPIGSGDPLLDQYLFTSGPAEDTFRLLRKISHADASLLIWGPSGTGKNLAAYVSHRLSPRRAAPFFEISCSSLPETLIETELFGYIKGAFTGASSDHSGRLMNAHTGTMVLDELDSLCPSAQAKLLRVVETGTFNPIGGRSDVRVDIRFIGLTQQNPAELVDAGLLRQDLYFRLSVFSLSLPRLNTYGERLPDLMRFIIEQESRILKQAPIELTDDVIKRLVHYSFPGNYRELQNLLRRWLILFPGQRITATHIPEAMLKSSGDEEWPSLGELEKDYIQRVLAHTRGRKSETARILGIHRKTLLEKRKLYGLD